MLLWSVLKFLRVKTPFFCEGTCQKWLHRTCAGLTDPAFDLVRESDDDFLCFQCSVAAHAKEIKELRALITSLSKELSTLTSQTIQAPSHTPSYPDVTQGKATQSALTTPHSTSSNTTSIHSTTTSAHSTQTTTVSHDRKFNLVFYGVSECPNGTP